MKVGILSESLHRPITGVENYLINLLKHLDLILRNNKTREVEIILIDRRISNKNFSYVPEMYDNFGKKLIYCPKLLEKVHPYLWYPYTLFKLKECTDFDVIHNPRHFPTFSKPKYARYIITVHDISPIIIKSKYSLRKFLFYRTTLKHSLKTADVIIADSYNTKLDIIRYFKIPENKIKVIYLGVDEDYKPLSETEIRKVRQKYHLNYPFILYVGSLISHKNIPTLIKAFYKLKKYGLPHKLVITGKRGWKYKNIFEIISKLNLQKDVVFTGYVQREDLPALYNAADLFVYPSLYEGFGLPPLEAMACGTPVITSNTSSLPEVVGNAGIMVDPYDIDGLAKAMYEVLTNEGLRAELRKRGLERAKMFSWKKTAEETLNVYKGI